MEERRQSLRRRTLLGGKIEFLDRSTFECVVRNLSETGARVRCDQQIALPDVFSLVIGKLDERRQVRAIWRRENEIGLKFMTAADYDNVLSFTPKLS
ncbi:MAG: pilus assembly protein PilZ [Methylocystis sp.]|nr:MAG: pilus assembly protein PilZ [Methylocystis sp.]